MGADICIHGDKPIGVVDVTGGASKIKLINTTSHKEKQRQTPKCYFDLFFFVIISS